MSFQSYKTLDEMLGEKKKIIDWDVSKNVCRKNKETPVWLDSSVAQLYVFKYMCNNIYHKIYK